MNRPTDSTAAPEQKKSDNDPASDIVWTPRQIEQTRMGRFMLWLERQGYGTFSNYHVLHRWSIENIDTFWSCVWEFCELTASNPADTVLGDRAMPGVEWFKGMALNFAANLLKPALGQNADREAVVAYCETRAVLRKTYSELYADVGALEAFLRSQGVTPGDRVAGIVTNGYEALAGMLAATSLGAIWTSASPDFGVGAILDRFSQIEPKALIAVNGYGYGGKEFPKQDAFANIIQGLSTLTTVVSIQQLPDQPPIGASSSDRTTPAGPVVTTWDAAIASGEGQRPSFAALPPDHPVYILYSSGTTGKPKCIVHGAAGLLVTHAKELMLHGDVRPEDRFLYFTTCGWMMWNWQASVLMTGATVITVDGNPGYPDLNFLWQLVANERVSHFGTSARFLAECRRVGLTPAANLDQQQLRVVFSTGSPLQPEDYDWVYSDGAPDALLGSIAGGTDICGCFVGATPLLPVRRSEIQCRMLGVDAEAFNDEGHAVASGRGELVCRQPLPSMPIYFWNDPDNRRYKEAYFETFPGVWAHGDFIEFTDFGGAIIHGRSDTTLNPGGVRIGTAEIYRQVEAIAEIKDSLVIGRNIDGDVEVVLLVVLSEGDSLSEALQTAVRSRIRAGASPRHVPKHIVEVPDIPYTRSGKKVELAVTRLVNGSNKSENRDALANPQALDTIELVLTSQNLISESAGP